VVGKIIATFFFSIFLLLGCSFTVMIGKSVWRVAETYRWSRADCEILSSAARQRAKGSDSSRPYEFVVEYRYHTGRDWLRATRWSTKEATFERIDEAQQLADRYRAGTRTECWRNPDDVRDVVLERQSLLFGFVALFPLIFVAVGTGGIWAVWRKSKPGERAGEKPVSERAANRSLGTGCLRGFFLLFFLAGAAVLWVMTLGPLIEIVGARSWEPAPARVISSRVAAHSDSDGNTYRVDILFAYTFDGMERQSSRYDFSRGSSSGYGTKAAIVSQYPAGAVTTCYVNPRRPSEAVLRREPFKALWFGSIGFVFLLVGALGIAGAGRLTGANRPARADGLPVAGTDPAVAGPVVLRPQQTRVTKFVGLLIFAIIWNAIIGVFVYLLTVRDPHAPFFAKLIVGILGLCGLGLIWAVFHQFLALFNPTVRLTASGQAIRLGSPLRLEWMVEGRAAKLHRLRITLEGREEATYRRGTDTHTDRNIFSRFVLLDTDEQARIATGDETFTVPANTMHSFEGRNNKVLWRLHVAGEIPRWPDLDDEYPMTILPQELPLSTN
jgi:hypothetical protein